MGLRNVVATVRGDHNVGHNGWKINQRAEQLTRETGRRHEVEYSLGGVTEIVDTGERAGG